MFEGQEETCIDWTGFNIQFEDFLSNLLIWFRLLKIIIYCQCVTDQQSVTISKICPSKFQDFSHHLSEVDKLLDASGKATPCHIPTYTKLSRDNPTCDL